MWKRRETAHFGKYFNALFWIPFGPEAMLSLRPFMASKTSSEVVKWRSLAGLK
jgi:hypothetical protein